jgi:hypothetical protein
LLGTVPALDFYFPTLIAIVTQQISRCSIRNRYLKLNLASKSLKYLLKKNVEYFRIGFPMLYQYYLQLIDIGGDSFKTSLGFSFF